MASACPEQSKAKRVDFLSPVQGQENVKAGRREQEGGGERNMVYSLQAYKGLQVIMRSNFPRKRGLSSFFKGKTGLQQKVRKRSSLITEEGQLAYGSFFSSFSFDTQRRPNHYNATSDVLKPTKNTAGAVQNTVRLATVARKMLPSRTSRQ